MSKNESLRRIEADLAKGKKAYLLQQARAGELDPEAIDIYGQHRDQSAMKGFERIVPRAYNYYTNNVSSTELAICRAVLVEYLENWQLEEEYPAATSEPMQTEPSKGLRKKILWQGTGERLKKWIDYVSPTYIIFNIHMKDIASECFVLKSDLINANKLPRFSKNITISLSQTRGALGRVSEFIIQSASLSLLDRAEIENAPYAFIRRYLFDKDGKPFYVDEIRKAHKRLGEKPKKKIRDLLVDITH